MSGVETTSTFICPNCHQPMLVQQFERHDHGKLRLELCFSCSALWLDHLVSMQLAPSAIIELFREIYQHRADSRRPVADRLACPRCRDVLVLSHDLSKTGRFSYYRCPRGDGRFTLFFQFLREKQFIRDLTEMELQRLRSQVRQIRCSECGAPIDLAHDSQCKYCHAPISFIDPDAVDKAMHVWSDAESRRLTHNEPKPVADALQRMTLRARMGDDVLLSGTAHAAESGSPLDLIALGVHAIGRLFQPGD